MPQFYFREIQFQRPEEEERAYAHALMPAWKRAEEKGFCRVSVAWMLHVLFPGLGPQGRRGPSSVGTVLLENVKDIIFFVKRVVKKK